MNFTPGERITINSRKYDGSIRRSWQCDFVRAEGDAIDLVGVFEQAVAHPDLGPIKAGTISKERFYLDRWYNYFLFEEPGAPPRNYYINICMPPTIGDRSIDYVDLDIDLIIWPDGRVATLDLEEFEANAQALDYPLHVRETAIKTLDELVSLLSDEGPGSAWTRTAQL